MRVRTMSGVLAAAAIGCSAIVVGGSAGATSRVPAKAPRATYSVTCENGVTGIATVTGQKKSPTSSWSSGRWTVAHVTGGTARSRVLVLTKIDLTFVFTSPSGTVTTTQSATKKAKAPNQTTCAVSGSRMVEGGSLSVTGTVTGAFH